MIVSPGSSTPSSFWNVSSVIFPDGTIIQTCARRVELLRERAAASSRSTSTFGSYVFIVVPGLLRAASSSPTPIRPRPTIPSCI